jgi:Uma2 family endonuclease
MAPHCPMKEQTRNMATVPETVTPLTPPPDKPDALYEFVDGEWKETPRMGAFATRLAFFLGRRLDEFAEKERLGVTTVETLFRLAPEGPARRPDVAFATSSRWPYTGPLEEDPAVLDLVPNLAVEVVSPSNYADEVAIKVRDYFFAGVELVWVIYPRPRLVYVHESPEQVRVLSEKRELDGGTVLPGFRLALASLFGAMGKPT